METLLDKAFFFIAGHGRGWAFSSSDLIGKFSRQQADNLLSDLVQAGKIRRVARGLYDYPKYSELLGQELGPDMDQVAQACARKFHWRIEISGESALNYLGLSTQVTGSYLYHSDGPSRTYDIMGTPLRFKKTALKNIGFKHRESALLVQSLHALGQAHITEAVLKKIRQQIDPKVCGPILRETRPATGWVYEAITRICQGAHHG